MSENTVTRYIVETKPRALSPFRTGWKWNPDKNAYDKVAVTNYRRVFMNKTGGISLRHGPGLHGLLTASEKKAVMKWAARRGWGIKTTVRSIDLYPRLTGDTDCKQDLLRRLNKVAEELNTIIHINSGNRTYAEQAALYADYLAGNGPLAAKPGTSNHNGGDAADCVINGANILDKRGAKASMKRNGLCCPVPGERWHVEVGNTWRN